MSYEIIKPKDEADWLIQRAKGIGGSDAGTVLGLNKYKTQRRFVEEILGLVEREDISDKPAVVYGKKAEELIRNLYVLDHPEYEMDYHGIWIYKSKENPFMTATLDGELTEKETGRKGIWECKTTTIQRQEQWEHWQKDKDGNFTIPDSYYCQILHQMAVTGWDFVELTARIRYYNAQNEVCITERTYHIERNEVLEDITALIEQEKEFWGKYIEKGIVPDYEICDIPEPIIL